VAGVLVTGFNTAPGNRLGDGVDFNDRSFLTYFPYIARPFDPLKHSHHRIEPSHAPGAQSLDSDGADATIEVVSDEMAGNADEDAPLQVRSANPAKSVLLRFTLGRDATVTLRIYDVAGRMVRALHDERSKAGVVDVAWDGRDDLGDFAGKGVFFARYSVDGKLVNTKKLVIQ